MDGGSSKIIIFALDFCFAEKKSQFGYLSLLSRKGTSIIHSI